MESEELGVVKVLRGDYGVLFVSEPSLSAVLVSLPSYSPSSVKGNALLGEIAAVITKRGCLDRPFIFRLFIVSCS